MAQFTFDFGDGSPGALVTLSGAINSTLTTDILTHAYSSEGDFGVYLRAAFTTIGVGDSIPDKLIKDAAKKSPDIVISVVSSVPDRSSTVGLFMFAAVALCFGPGTWLQRIRAARCTVAAGPATP